MLMHQNKKVPFVHTDLTISASLPVLQTGSSDPYFIDPDFEEFANGSLFSDVLDDLSSPSFDPDEAVTPADSGFKNFGLDQFSDNVTDLPGSYLSNLGSWPPAPIWQQSSGQDLNLLNSPFNPLPSFEFPLRTDSSCYHHQADEAPRPLAQFGSLSPPEDSLVKRYDQLHDLSIRKNLGPKEQRQIQYPFENARPRHRNAESHCQQPDIARQSYQNLAQSLEPTLLQRQPAQDGLILEDEFAAAANTPYDPLWIEHYGLDPSQITFSPSAMKFDKLFLEKVIKVGDKLVLIPEHTPDAESITPPLRNVATVLSITRCPQHFPDLHINSCSSLDGILIQRCAGTKQLALALIKEDSRLSAITPSRAWKHFRLYRANVNLGTLWDVRLRYNLWIDQVDAWAVRNDQPRRHRRRPRGTNVVFRDGLFQILVPGGGMVVCEDQHAFDASRRRGVGRRKSAA